MSTDHLDIEQRASELLAVHTQEKGAADATSRQMTIAEMQEIVMTLQLKLGSAEAQVQDLIAQDSRHAQMMDAAVVERNKLRDEGREKDAEIARLKQRVAELEQALAELIFSARGLVEEKYLRDARAALKPNPSPPPAPGP